MHIKKLKKKLSPYRVAQLLDLSAYAISKSDTVFINVIILVG